MKAADTKPRYVSVLVVAALLAAVSKPADAQAETVPAYLADRGTGIATSMFGTYIQDKELITYLFFEYYYDHKRSTIPPSWDTVSIRISRENPAPSKV
jgi:hypothetical protein